jgi:hypothetical protein
MVLLLALLVFLMSLALLLLLALLLCWDFCWILGVSSCFYHPFLSLTSLLFTSAYAVCWHAAIA